MTEPTMALMEYLRNVGLEPDEGFLQEGLQRLTQTVMELEAAGQIGAGRYERTPERKTYRNGHRERVWETRVGEIPLRIPKVRDGSYFPSLLEPRRRSEKALLAVVQQAYVEGVSTRRVDDLLQALGLTGIDKSRVSRICKELDEVVEPFRNRPLEGQYPFVRLDALYLKVRQNHRIVSQALVIATGVREMLESGEAASVRSRSAHRPPCFASGPPSGRYSGPTGRRRGSCRRSACPRPGPDPRCASRLPCLRRGGGTPSGSAGALPDRVPAGSVQRPRPPSEAKPAARCFPGNGWQYRSHRQTESHIPLLSSTLV